MSRIHSNHWAEQLRTASHTRENPLADGSASRLTLEGYFQAIAEHLEREELDEALHLSASLPQICSALEHPRLTTSPAHCICWCDAWVAADSDGVNVYPLTRVYLQEEQAALQQWIGMDSEFLRSVSVSLLRASRAWYLRRGAYDLTVQQNLGRVSAPV
jgi:hypothetical protein